MIKFHMHSYKYNFRSYSNKFPTILAQKFNFTYFTFYIFNFTYFRLFFVEKRKLEIFRYKNVMDWGIRKILTFEYVKYLHLKCLGK